MCLKVQLSVGTGNIADDVDVYGRLEPGSNGIGTLTLKNFASDDSVSLYLRPTTEMEFEIASPTHHDSLIVDGHLVYYNQTQDFMESDEKPVVRIKIDDSYVYNEGDEFVLISYKGKSSLWGDPWDFNVKLPDTEKWAVEERTTETGKQFVLVAKSTSGVKSTESEDRVRIYTQSGNICVESEAGDVIRLYSTSGQLLKSETARQGLTLIEALPGTYVIEVAGQSTTIVNY